MKKARMPPSSSGKHLARREAAFQRLGQQVQRRRGQQQAGGEAHREAQPLLRQAEHHQRGAGHAEQAAEQAGKDDLGEERQVHRDGADTVKREAPFNHRPATNATVLHLWPACGFIRTWPAQAFHQPPPISCVLPASR
jgi:hypothetical protein